MNSEAEASGLTPDEMWLDWSGADEVAVRPASVFWLQGTGDSFILTVGQAFPSTATSNMSVHDREKYIATNGLKVHGIVRLSLSISAIKGLKEFLADVP